MVKLDHLTIFVADEARSRDWYVAHFGWQVEFDVPERHTIALQDDSGMTLFLVREPAVARSPSCILTLQVTDVDTKHRELSAAGVPFEKPPQKLSWGYGAELRDPDGYLVRLWDETSMREKGGA
jgi:catechol 2,3-dioxygenase-like lactoylglutathione lyase family enzyme